MFDNRIIILLVLLSQFSFVKLATLHCP